MSNSKIESPVIIFDGICNYCNTMVNFVICNDKKAKLRFATLQSVTGIAIRKKYNVPNEIDSLIFIENDTAYIYASAALHICKYLDWPAKFLYTLNIFPSFISNSIYKWIAHNRYKWFGKKDACMVPTLEVRNRFLD